MGDIATKQPHHARRLVGAAIVSALALAGVGLEMAQADGTAYCGGLTIAYTGSSYGYISGNTVVIDQNTNATISGTTTTCTIQTAAGTSPTITLNGASITSADLSPIDIQGLAATIVLAPGSNNTLASTANDSVYYDTTKGPAILLGANANLTITGAGALTATATGYGAATIGTPEATVPFGSITITGGANVTASVGNDPDRTDNLDYFPGGAAIGTAGCSDGGGTITIDNATVHATGASGASIGQGETGGSHCVSKTIPIGTITIRNNAHVTVDSVYDNTNPPYNSNFNVPALIGGRRTSNVNNTGSVITITDSKVIANSDYSVGIGAGSTNGNSWRSDTPTITISNSYVEAISTDLDAALRHTNGNVGIGAGQVYYGGISGTTWLGEITSTTGSITINQNSVVYSNLIEGLGVTGENASTFRVFIQNSVLFKYRWYYDTVTTEGSTFPFATQRYWQYHYFSTVVSSPTDPSPDANMYVGLAVGNPTPNWDFEVPANSVLVITSQPQAGYNSSTLTIQPGVSLVNNGTIHVEVNGTLVNQAPITGSGDILVHWRGHYGRGGERVAGTTNTVRYNANFRFRLDGSVYSSTTLPDGSARPTITLGVAGNCAAGATYALKVNPNTPSNTTPSSAGNMAEHIFRAGELGIPEGTYTVCADGVATALTVSIDKDHLDATYQGAVPLNIDYYSVSYDAVAYSPATSATVTGRYGDNLENTMPGTTSTSNPYAVPKGTRVKLTCLGSVPAGYVAEYLWTDAAGIQLGTDPELEYAAVDAPVWAYCEVTARLNATSASAFIRFDDANNQDGKRPIPYTTTVELWQQVWNGSSYGSATHVAGKDITATIPSGQTFVSLTPTEWTGLPVGSDPSHPTKYQAVAVTVPTDYTATYTYTGNTDTEITLTHVPETTSVTVTKVWADTGFETLRPAAITVQILANGTPVGSAVTLNGSESTPWSFTQTGLAKYAAGSLITYTVTEGLPSGAADPVALSRYARTTTRTTTTTGAYVFTVTNTFDQTYLNHTVTKVWQDDGDRDGLRPASIQVQLEVSYPVSGPVSDPVYGAWAAYTGNIFDGSALVAIGGGNTVTLSGTDTTPWAYQWTGLPAYVVGGTYDNVAVKYRAREISTLPTGYTTTYGDDGFTITNAHTPATTSFTVRKVWDDGDDLDGLRESPSFTLSGGGQTYGPVTIPTANLADDVWTYRWTGVPENSAGSAITYVVIEGDIPAGYAITATGGLTPHDLDNTDPDTTTRVGYEITNTHVPTTVLIDPDDLFVADETKVYGEPDPSPFHINGLPAGSYTATFTRTPGEDVGLYAIRVATLTFTDPNFRLVGTIADITPGTLTITKRPVVVQVGTQTVAETGQTITRCLAATAGTTGVGPSGLVSGHQLAPACVNASGVAPGTYPAGAAAAAFSVLDGGSDVTSNYDVTVADGALIITAVEGPGDQGTSGPSPSTSPGPAASPSPGASTPPAVTPSVTPSGQGKVPAGPTVAPSAAPSPGASLPVMGSDATTPATLALLLAALGLLLLAKARRARLAGPPKHRA